MINNSRVKTYIPRTLEGKIRRYLESPEIIAILGARQAGKTTLMRRVFEPLTGSKVFLDFEDREVLALFDEEIKAFADLYVKGKSYLFIDEFQYSARGGKNLKYLYDNYPTKCVISGSSSLDIALQAASFLVGRIFSLELYPLGFHEFLSWKEPDLYGWMDKRSGILDPIPQVLHERLLGIWREYLTWGGYPRLASAQDSEEKREVLKGIMNTYLLKDVQGFFRLASESSIQKLLRALTLQTGNLIHYNELSQVSGLAFPALKRHLAILEETYITHLIRPYFTNKRLELVKNPKAYFCDSGLRNYICGDFRDWSKRSDAGALFENGVLLELVRQGIEPNYWRTKSGGEVDFVISNPSGPIPIEVKSGVTKRPGMSLISFIDKYQPRFGVIYNAGLPKVDSVRGTRLYYLPCYLAGQLPEQIS